MTTHPTISVIIPNYNCAMYVAQAIQSVLDQTYPPQELIVVDDGSTDGSRGIIERYGAAVKLIPLAHSGRPGFVRNRGIEAARGTVIAFVDADDVWLPSKLAIQMAYLEAHPEVGLVHSNLQVIDAQGRYLRDIFLGCPGSRGLSDDYPESSFMQLVNGDSNVWTSSVIVRHACLERVGGFPENFTVGEDYHLWIRIAREFRVGYIPEALAKHRKHAANTGTSWAGLCPPQEVQLWNHILDLFPDLRQTHGRLIHAKSLFHYIVAALHCAHQRRYLKATRLLLVGATTHLANTRYRYVKGIAQKYLMIRRLQREHLALARSAR
jgi:glycosyltransferase involved in cell wall biosynthesis